MYGLYSSKDNLWTKVNRAAPSVCEIIFWVTCESWGHEVCQALPAMGMKGRSEKTELGQRPCGGISVKSHHQKNRRAGDLLLWGAALLLQQCPNTLKGVCLCVVTAAEVLQATGPSPFYCSGHSFNQSKLCSWPTPLALSESRYRPSALPS